MQHSSSRTLSLTLPFGALEISSWKLVVLNVMFPGIKTKRHADMFDLATSKKITDGTSHLLKTLTSRKTIKEERSDHPDGDITRLFIDHPGISPSEISIKRNENRLEILIVPEFPDGLIPHPESPENRFRRPEHAKELFQLYGHLTWSQSSAEDIYNCLAHSISIGSDEDKDDWVVRASKIISIVVAALVSLRDTGHEKLNVETFRHHLPLDAVIALAFDERLDEAVRNSVLAYLDQLPGYRGADALTIPQYAGVYEHHGYACMQIRHLETPSERAIGRSIRLPVEAYYYTIKEAYRSVEYCVTADGLVVKIHHHPKKALVRLADD